MTELRRRPARQADVARVAGVSQATVSSVITGSGDRYGIAQETRDKVWAAAASLGYVPSVAARQLRGTGNSLIGVHTFESIFPISQLNFYNDFLVGIEEEAVVAGYNLLLFTATDRSTGRRSLFMDGESPLTIADGTILLGLDREKSELVRLASSGYPFVHIGRRVVEGAEIPFVAPDYQKGVASAVLQLIELGHAHIAYLRDDVTFEANTAKRDGYVDAMARHGLDAVFIDTLEQDAAQADLGDVTACLAEDSTQLRWIESLASQRGIRIPDDLSVIALSGTAEAVREHWTTLTAPRRRLGVAAVQLLVEILEGRPTPGFRYLPCLPLNDDTLSTAPRR